MKQKLLSLQPSTWYSLEGRPDINEITNTIKQLQSEKHEFKFTDDGDKFMLVSVYEPDKPIMERCFFDYVGQPGYRTEKLKLEYGKVSEEIFYNDKLIAIR